MKSDQYKVTFDVKQSSGYYTRIDETVTAKSHEDAMLVIMRKYNNLAEGDVISVVKS